MYHACKNCHFYQSFFFEFLNFLQNFTRNQSAVCFKISMEDQDFWSQKYSYSRKQLRPGTLSKRSIFSEIFRIQCGIDPVAFLRYVI